MKDKKKKVGLLLLRNLYKLPPRTTKLATFIDTKIAVHYFYPTYR